MNNFHLYVFQCENRVFYPSVRAATSSPIGVDHPHSIESLVPSTPVHDGDSSRKEDALPLSVIISYIVCVTCVPALVCSSKNNKEINSTRLCRFSVTIQQRFQPWVPLFIQLPVTLPYITSINYDHHLKERKKN